MDKIVTRCNKCPFATYWEFVGMHCEHPVFDNEFSEQQYIEEYTDKNTSPDYCPLKMETVTISFKQDNK